MTMTVFVEDDGLAIRNTSDGESGTDERRDGTVLRADCDDFRKFLSEAKAGKFDDLV